MIKRALAQDVLESENLFQPAELDLSELLGLDVGDISVILLSGFELKLRNEDLLKSPLEFLDLLFTRVLIVEIAEAMILVGLKIVLDRVSLLALTSEEAALVDLIRFLDALEEVRVRQTAFVHEAQAFLWIVKWFQSIWSGVPFLNFSQVKDPGHTVVLEELLGRYPLSLDGLLLIRHGQQVADTGDLLQFLL